MPVVQGNVIRIVPAQISEDAAQAARDLLQDILDGKTVGFAIVAMHKTYSWTLDIAGDCKHYPALTRGRLLELDAAIAALNTML